MRDLALLMLLDENLRRRTGAPLVPAGTDPARVAQLADDGKALGCAVAVLGVPDEQQQQQGQQGAVWPSAAELLYANAAAAEALAHAAGPGAAAAAAIGARLQLPACASAVALTPEADCVVAEAAEWAPSGVSGGDSGGGEALVVDRLLVCPVTAPNGARSQYLLHAFELRDTLACARAAP